jgi:cell fate regulator YaaT (PSP1 superfamily)
MYNIDLTFLQSKELEVENKQPDKVYNELLRKYVIKSICPNDLETDHCDNCSVLLERDLPNDSRNIVEVECNGMDGHHFCEIKSNQNLNPQKNDIIIIKSGDYNEIATADEVGKIVKIRRERLGMANEEIPEVVRIATEEDLEKYRNNLNDELKARPIFHEKVEKYKLNMKLVDVHYQFDRKRLFFFYTSDGRVDFRELAKELAGIFKTRIELRQIGVRDEAKKMGGIGSCGREYCCSSFLYSFKRITTQIAADQNNSTNLSKLSGPCCKLKCCLSFELNES